MAKPRIVCLRPSEYSNTTQIGGAFAGSVAGPPNASRCRGGTYMSSLGGIPCHPGCGVGVDAGIGADVTGLFGSQSSCTPPVFAQTVTPGRSRSPRLRRRYGQSRQHCHRCGWFQSVAPIDSTDAGRQSARGIGRRYEVNCTSLRSALTVNTFFAAAQGAYALPPIRLRLRRHEPTTFPRRCAYFPGKLLRPWPYG